MATPRKRYFRVADSILREPWPREHRIALVFLMAHLNTRWRRDGIPDAEAGQCYLSEGDLQNITGLKRIRSGFALLSKLSGSVSLEVSLRDGLVFVNWPKFPEFQNFGTRSQGSEQPQDEPLPSPSPSPKNSTTPPPPSSAEPEPRREREKVKQHPDAPRLASLLRDELAAHVAHWTPPRSLTGWETDLDRMLRLGGPTREGIPPPDIETVIRWVVRDEFEQKNVQSASKLRKRFGALFAKATAISSRKQGRLEIIGEAMEKSRERDRERAQRRQIEGAEAGGSGGDVRRLRSGL